MEESNHNKKQQEENKGKNGPSQKEGDQQQGKEAQQDSPEPDVILDIPKLKFDEINLKVDDLKAKVSLSAKLADFVQIDVGAEIHIETVDVEIKGVEAEAQLRVRLERVKQILNRTLETIDNNPDVLKAILEPVGEGAGDSAGGLVQKAGKALGGGKVKETVKGIGDKISDIASPDDDERKEAESGQNQEESEGAEISAGPESSKN